MRQQLEKSKMLCNICHEEYRGLAADCACTMYGFSDEEEFRDEASEYEIQAYERSQRTRWMDKVTAPRFVRMSGQGNPVYRFPWTYYIRKHRFLVACLALGVLVIALSGCAGGLQQVNDTFELPMHEYARKWEGGLSHWTIEDIHVHTNRVVADKHYNPKRPQLNGYCWETAEMKHDLAVESGIDPADMEIIVFLLHEDTAITRKVESGSTHAVLRVGDTIYDNGFIAKVPFDATEIPRYGKIVTNTWSEEKYL